MCRHGAGPRSGGCNTVLSAGPSTRFILLFDNRRRVHPSELGPRRFSISRSAHLPILIALRERSGIGVFAAQCGPRRGFSLGIRQKLRLARCIRYNLNDSLLDRSMNMSTFRAAFGVMFALAMLSLAPPSSAQQKTPPAPQQPPALSQSQPPALSAQAAPPAQAP